MQLEDKLVDGLDAAKTESRQREDVEDRGAKVLPAPVVEAMHNASVERREQLLGAVRMLLDRQHLAIEHLRLPKRETVALEALQVATTGRSNALGQFVFASDRRDLLERALGVLQPDLVHVNDGAARELNAQFDDLEQRVGDLRAELTQLEDAQDELLSDVEKARMEEATDDTADASDKPKPKPGAKPKPAPKPSDPDAPRPPTTLTGPDLPPEPAAKTTLAGPDLPPEPPAKTTLAGPDLPPEPPAKTTLSGPDLPPEPPAKTTLSGPDLAAEPAPATSLGDAGDIAEVERKPWWRRPFG